MALVALSAVFHLRQRDRWALLWLTLGGLCLYVMAARLFPFLNIWDEQYHALAAKNCMSHPLRPTLYEDAVVPGHDYGSWIASHIWLHKQPLFLWQIALCYKLFGVSVFTTRLPSVVMCTLLIPLNYRMATLLTQRRDIAYFTALATATSWFLIGLTSGSISTDHNDVCFLFYVTASVWAFMEYVHRGMKSWLWALLAGLLAGGAMLTKWLVGLLPFLAWGCYLLAEKGLRLREWRLLHLTGALAVTLCLFLSWQLYTLHQFPTEARQELMLYIEHAGQVVEDHSGPWNFYLIVLPLQFFGYGPAQNNIHFIGSFHTILCYAVLAVGLVLALRVIRGRSQRITLLAVLLFVFAFFSYAQTKMPAFTFVVSFIGFLSIGCVYALICRGIVYLMRPRWLLTVTTALLCAGFGFYGSHYPNLYRECNDKYYGVRAANKTLFEGWKDQVDEGTLIFNVMTPAWDNFEYTSCVAATFFSGRECYFDTPPIEDLKELQRQGYPIAAVRNPWIPDAYEQDSSIVKLEIR
mgnify:CR=1 FL=1